MKQYFSLKYPCGCFDPTIAAAAAAWCWAAAAAAAAGMPQQLCSFLEPWTSCPVWVSVEARFLVRALVASFVGTVLVDYWGGYRGQ
jgi:hypothetical protein